MSASTTGCVATSTRPWARSTLFSSDANTRYAAAQAVFKSRAVSVLPAVEKALAGETSSSVKLALEQAQAAIVLNMPDATDAQKLAAISVIRKRGDQDLPGLLSAIPGHESPPVAQAATEAITAIQGRLAEWDAVQNAWYGLSLGSVLLLAAIGLAITFGVMGVINMAHGEMVMLGAYVTYVVQETIRTNDLRRCSTTRWRSLSRSPSCFPALWASYRTHHHPLSLRASFGDSAGDLGLSLVLQQAVRTAFGPTNKEVGNPSFMSGAFDLGGITITYNRLWIICFALAVFVALIGLLRFTRLGLEMRAVTQNRAMAPPWASAPPELTP